jgi:hypothetical protein
MPDALARCWPIVVVLVAVWATVLVTVFATCPTVPVAVALVATPIVPAAGAVTSWTVGALTRVTTLTAFVIGAGRNRAGSEGSVGRRSGVLEDEVVGAGEDETEGTDTGDDGAEGTAGPW